MITDICKMFWRWWPLGCVLMLIGILTIIVTLLLAFTNVWPAAHAWLNSTPCPDDQSCQWLRIWYWP